MALMLVPAHLPGTFLKSLPGTFPQPVCVLSFRRPLGRRSCLSGKADEDEPFETIEGTLGAILTLPSQVRVHLESCTYFMGHKGEGGTPATYRIRYLAATMKLLCC